VGKTEQRIAEFIVETSLEDIPAECYTAAREACFDCIGVTLAGAAQAHGRMIVDFVAEEGARGDCTVLGSPIRTSPSMAAFANGTLGHALDYDDMGGFGHPSVVLLPPALALGERAGLSGRELLGGYVIGFEVARHLSKGSHYVQGERGFHSTGVFGTMAATAAACRLLGLGVDQTVIALGIAGSMPSGVLQNFGTHTKPLHAGLASRSGVTAALLAQKGFLGSDNIIESKVGWAAAYMGAGNYDPAAMVKGLGSDWASASSIVIKKYPCCGSNHSTLDSLLGLIREHNIGLEQVEAIEVRGLPALSHVLLYPDPSSSFQGKFSLPYNVATALVDGQINMASFEGDRVMRPEYREALSKVEIKIRSKWDPDYEDHPSENPVTICLKDGRTFTRATNRHQMHGTPTDPLSESELQEKFRNNARLSLSESEVERAISLWWRLDEVADVREATVLAGVPV
jgi:2-methylcitrate dehydratase PrpD